MPSSVASPVFSWIRATGTPGSELHLVSDVMTVSSIVRFSGRDRGKVFGNYQGQRSANSAGVRRNVCVFFYHLGC